MNATAFMNTKTPFEQIRKNFSDLKPLEEKLKDQISIFYQNEMLVKEMNEEDINDLKFYTEKEHPYFNNNEYMEHNLQLLIKAINYLPYFLHRKYFYHKKELLAFMKELQEQHSMAKIS
jgi:hypothetical protein